MKWIQLEVLLYKCKIHRKCLRDINTVSFEYLRVNSMFFGTVSEL